MCRHPNRNQAVGTRRKCVAHLVRTHMLQETSIAKCGEVNSSLVSLRTAVMTDIAGTLLGSGFIPAGNLVAGETLTVTVVAPTGGVVGFATVIVSAATRRLIETTEADRGLSAANNMALRGLQASGINVRNVLYPLGKRSIARNHRQSICLLLIIVSRCPDV